MIGDDGSTAITATVRPCARSAAMSVATSVDLPAPGRPRDPDEVGAARERVEAPERVLGDGRVVLDPGQQAGERPPVARAGGVGEVRGARRRGLGHDRRPARATRGASRWRG